MLRLCRMENVQDFEFKIRPTISLRDALARLRSLHKAKNCKYIPIQTQNFTENQNQDHAHIDPRLLHVSPDALWCISIVFPYSLAVASE